MRFIVPIWLLLLVQAAGTPAAPAKSKKKPDENALQALATAVEKLQEPVKEPPTFSISLGQSQLFSPTSLEGDIKKSVPSQSVMFLGQWFFTYAWRVVAVFNLPTRPLTRFVDGVLVEEFSPSSFALGFAWTPLGHKFNKKRRIELEIGVLGGTTLERRPIPFPLFATRLSLLHKSDLAIYIGGAFAARRSTTALMYGVEYRF